MTLARIADCSVEAALAVVLLASAFAHGCDSTEFKDQLHGTRAGADAAVTEQDGAAPGEASRDDSNGAGASDSGAAAAAQRCVPAVSADKLRPRDSVMTAKGRGASAGPSGVFTRDLFNLFRTNCGACHVEQSLGGLRVSLDDFATKVGPEALMRLTSDDKAFFMPPAGGGGKPFSERSAGDPIVELASLLEGWIAAGRPADVFYPAGTSTADTATADYRLSPEVGMQMTNLANCIPDKAMVGMDETKANELDALFEQATELPERLEQTDMYTFDAEILARDGVVAIAPAYTLWADNAKKIRTLRIPRGTSIEFDKAKQSFKLPANTRFYKTFLKRVRDLRGHESYRKMETRLIVSRPDEVMPDGSRRFTALFGTYAWNEQETEAVLVRDPLRDGSPFRDRLVTYVIDEQQADAVIAEAPENLEKELEKAGLTRTYAIPGSTRCVQCHMGSPNADFSLGFTPLQIRRRPLDEGGVIEPAERDELNQLQRLIDYGIITGMASPDDVALLEDSQGERKPRNEQELIAQGYLVGNCAHCHNPHGFPSVSSPELKEVLNFLPGEKGGIFQFPLEHFSPRVFRGDGQNVKIPYITPSLFDFGEPAFASLTDPGSATFYAIGTPQPGLALTQPRPQHLLAPWRSLIYRNVDTPFSYVDDKAIFPHMPRHTPGYDCRARRVLGEWMVSIPARLKDRSLLPGDRDAEVVATQKVEQPYEEVKSDDPDYTLFSKLAKRQLSNFRDSPRHADCPDPEFDVLDPRIRDNSDLLAPVDTEVKGPTLSYNLPIPSRAHWFVTDLTNAPGDWYPRRADWESVIRERKPELLRVGELELIEMLSTLHVTEPGIRELALTEAPFGLWVDKPDCRFPSGSNVADIPMEQRPRWMRGVPNAPKPPEDAHVYRISAGNQIFNQICRNCHGPQADSKSRLADTIADLTGGATRVANLRDGILGPITNPAQNRKRVFGPLAADGETADDWAARYIVWMTLGGTQRQIPPAAVDVILNAYVLGERRHQPYAPAGKTSANMLETAQHICGFVAPIGRELVGLLNWEFDPLRGVPLHEGTSDGYTYKTVPAGTIFKNGDAELWERICQYQNPVPVRAIKAEYIDKDDRLLFTFDREVSPDRFHLYRRDRYGFSPVGDQHGAIRSAIDTLNTAPWCIRVASTEVRPRVDEFWAKKAAAGTQPPYCPPAFLTDENRLTLAEHDAWTRRGAANAGLAVFLYLDALARGEKQRTPDYDRCEELTDN